MFGYFRDFWTVGENGSVVFTSIRKSYELLVCWDLSDFSVRMYSELFVNLWSRFYCSDLFVDEFEICWSSFAFPWACSESIEYLRKYSEIFEGASIGPNFVNWWVQVRLRGSIFALTYSEILGCVRVHSELSGYYSFTFFYFFGFVVLVVFDLFKKCFFLGHVRKYSESFGDHSRIFVTVQR